MSRILLQYLLPLVLPTVLFFLYTWISGPRQGDQGAAAQAQRAPWFWLILAGFVLMAAGLAFTALTGGGIAGSEYIPPRFEDGRVVPAEIR
ncbi:MAG: hypothetical protein EA406_01030 [Rhodospirillales bacterium]|nr:MAG: hypothetical protein EA406_01030 [Rhodospirillales bacterium]